MKNSNENQNQNEELETMSFSDFFLELPLKVILGFLLFLYVVAMGVVILYVKLVK